MQTVKSAMRLLSVNGEIDPARAGITDAHNHVWIERIPGTPHNVPVLENREAIISELIDFREAGGGTIIDCQPGGCGRNGEVLRQLAESSGVNILACTGFHLRKYYPDDYWLFQATTKTASQFFLSELEVGLEETRYTENPVLAGFIKLACKHRLEDSPWRLMEAAVAASIETGCAMQVHTEKGADAERIVQALLDFGASLDRLVLCHMDKRADFRLHADLAQEGIMLVYDTFFRPKYLPEENVWPLIEKMVKAGFSSHIAIATDLAQAGMWSKLGNGPGLTGLITRILPRLERIGIMAEHIDELVGRNIVNRLARPNTPSP